jgi:hypothetical protein
MSRDKYGQLVDRLFAKTNSGLLDWRISASPRTFQVSFRNQSILLSARLLPDSEDVVPEFKNTNEYSLSIVNDSGEIVDEIEEYELDVGHRTILEDLYKAARRKALDVDKVLDDLLSALA